MSALLFPAPAGPIERGDVVRLADGRRALVVEAYETNVQRRLTVCPVGTSDAVYTTAAAVRLIERGAK